MTESIVTDHLLSRRSLLAATGLGAAAALAGCSSAGGATDGGSADTVRLTHGPISVPKIRGELDRALQRRGLKVRWIGPFPNHAPTLQAVATGTADFSFGGSSTPADQAILSGADVVYVAWATTWPRTTAILVRPSSGIAKVADLAGRTVAVNKAGLGEFLLVAALEKYQVPRERVKMLYMNPTEAASAFASGKIDAWAIWEGFREIAEVRYGARAIFVEGDELDRQIDFRTYLVRRDYAREHPDIVRAVIAAYQADQEWQNAHFREAIELGNGVSKYPQEVIDRLVQHRTTQKLRLMDDEGIEQLQYGADWLAERGILSDRIKIADHAVKL
ncbi:ABC transporter substrate-binding protein [Actinomadura sp. NBRC 104425]|uniref:NrtA/SsuA/CpmA family ABC transporter substrate-binding protein n=1 Tax=Actinomadura sp. NBRC 104425 TaxID=3032204 RepID=UPI0024A4FD7A|nr:NrtA/SsuA/CpmA family ABC transporter substrate-binding protein [Actinomadura sp. NBRC 104425]GLZ13366.1 ABC transporter substrate-binding protein [Actinomadura sp. NBRC 104425]